MKLPLVRHFSLLYWCLIRRKWINGMMVNSYGLDHSQKGKHVTYDFHGNGNSPTIVDEE